MSQRKILTRGSQGAKSLSAEEGSFPKKGKLEWSVYETTSLEKACRTVCRLAFSHEVQGKVHTLLHYGWVYPSAKYFVEEHVGLVENWKEQGALEGTGCFGLWVNFLGLLQQILITWWLETTEIYFHSVLEAEIPEWFCGPGKSKYGQN